MKKIHLVSLGCAKNLVDSEQMLAMFPRDAFSLTSHPEEADLIIVNTCGFIESAKKESLDTIFEMAGYDAKLAVVGCLAQRYEEDLKRELPEADDIIAIHDYDEFPKRISALIGDENILHFNPLRRILTTSKGTAYLRISEGCNNFCAFCAIPRIRGTFVSRPFDEIIKEAKILKDEGIKEISLISQDTTVYGSDFEGGHPNIVDLLKALEDIGFFSIRLLYLYPSEISEELIEHIAKSSQIAHYFDIPVQAASDHMLTAMRRHAGAKETLELFDKIKRICPDAILRTTLISGFPGENEEDQKETIDFLEQVQFHHMGVFAYSREEDTVGYYLDDQIEEEVKESRKDELMSIQRHISYKRNKEMVGKEMDGIVIGRKKDGRYSVRTYWNAPDDIDGQIYLDSPVPLEEGDLVRIKIEDSFVYDLTASLKERL